MIHYRRVLASSRFRWLAVVAVAEVQRVEQELVSGEAEPRVPLSKSRATSRVLVCPLAGPAEWVALEEPVPVAPGEPAGILGC